MKDFNYHPGAELDGRLEQVIESHRETVKESSTPAAEPESGLQAFVGRQTIAEEIAGITPTKVADLREELARERIEEIIDARSSKLDSFHDAVKTAAAEVAPDPVKTATDLIRSGIDPKEAARRALT